MNGEINVAQVGAQLDGAREVVRLWIAKDGPNSVFIDADPIDDPRTFGRLVVDILKHGAMGFAHSKGMDPQQAFEGIMQGLSSEIQKSNEAAQRSTN